MSKSKTISKNARTNRGSNLKIFTNYKGNQVEIAPVMFYGIMNNSKNYMAVQNKSNKEILLDQSGEPLAWGQINKVYSQA